MQVVKAVDGVGRAIREIGVVLEGPALLPEARDGVGDRHGAFELLERAEDQRPVRPGAAMGHIEMIAPGLRAEARRPVRRDAITKTAVGAPELSGLADLLGKLLAAPPPHPEHPPAG